MKVNNTLMLSILILLVGSIGNGFAQEKTTDKKDNNRIDLNQDDESKTAKEQLGPDASKSLYLITVDTFEEVGEWTINIPEDQGIATTRRVLGAPLALKKQGKKEVKVPPKYRKPDGVYERKYYRPYTDNKKYILGAKVNFYKRGHNWFSIHHNRPIRLDGIVKAFEVWVCGREKQHTLYIIVEDLFGKELLIKMDKLNFLGWKRLKVTVPLYVVQDNYRFTSKRGLKFKGFFIKVDPLESYGKYYVYFDNLVAEVDRFKEESRNVRDPIDNW